MGKVIIFVMVAPFSLTVGSSFNNNCREYPTNKRREGDILYIHTYNIQGKHGTSGAQELQLGHGTTNVFIQCGRDLQLNGCGQTYSKSSVTCIVACEQQSCCKVSPQAQTMFQTHFIGRDLCSKVLTRKDLFHYQDSQLQACTYTRHTIAIVDDSWSS